MCRFRASSPVRVLGGAVLVLTVAAVVLSALIGQLSIGVPAGLVAVLAFACGARIREYDCDLLLFVYCARLSGGDLILVR